MFRRHAKAAGKTKNAGLGDHEEITLDCIRNYAVDVEDDDLYPATKCKAYEAILGSKSARLEKSMAHSPEDEGPDSGEDIPYKKSVASPDDEGESSEQGEDQEEEYTIEEIISHKTDKRVKGFLFHVKWVGYEETSWEPIENLQETVHLEKYLRKHKDVAAQVAAKKTKKGTPSQGDDTRKRRASDVATPTTNNNKISRSSKKPRHGATAVNGSDLETNISTGGATRWKAPAGTWEDHVVGVDTLERAGEGGELYAFIEWDNGHKSRHPTRVLHSKCPLTLLRYFESHLFFANTDRTENESASDPVTKTDKVRAAITASQNPVKNVAAAEAKEDAKAGGDDRMVNESEDVKAVASAI